MSTAGAGNAEDACGPASHAHAVLYRDESIVAVDKPGGLLVHRTREAAGERRALLQEVAAQVGRYLYPVHRLDRATSGIVVFALSSEDARRLQESLGSPGARKEYLALARGETAERFCVGRPLRDERGARKEARSSFRRLAVFAGCSLLLARIHTGRRHQIRRHLAHCAHQLLGDTTYGKGGINRYFRESFSMPRLCLHAWHLGFEHPRTGRRIGLRAPLAADLREFLARLPDCPASLLDRL